MSQIFVMYNDSCKENIRLESCDRSILMGTTRNLQYEIISYTLPWQQSPMKIPTRIAIKTDLHKFTDKHEAVNTHDSDRFIPLHCNIRSVLGEILTQVDISFINLGVFLHTSAPWTTLSRVAVLLFVVVFKCDHFIKNPWTLFQWQRRSSQFTVSVFTIVSDSFL